MLPYRGGWLRHFLATERGLVRDAPYHTIRNVQSTPIWSMSVMATLRQRLESQEYHDIQVRVPRRNAMASCRAILATALALVTSCVAQQIVNKFDNSSRLIRDVLQDAHVSGSLEYSAGCDFHTGRFPIVPHVHTPSSSGSPVDDVRSMFGGNPKMRVTQEPSGIVRMAETDVPLDILEVKIHHISFHASLSGPGPVGGPRLAMMRVFAAPEVKAFLKEHDIANDAFRLEGIYPNLPEVAGELNDVTVSQALDYILKSFPGYWVYENCTTPDGRRSVNFDFH
jgi:hypothetical protein